MLNEKKFFNKRTITFMVASVIILALLIVITVTGWAKEMVTCPYCQGSGLFNGEKCSNCDGACIVVGSIWALLPPIIAIVLALITKEVFSSLFIGLLSGAIIGADFAPLETIDNVVNTGLISAVSGTAGIFVFLIELGILVCLVNKAGGSRAFGEWAQKHIKTRVGAILCTFVLGILIFIDDYFNCLTVGSVMKPVTDSHKVSRSKLAYLIDSTAAPICMIAPISSWAAAFAQYASDGKGFNIFIAAIPFNFYSILTLVFILMITLLKVDFGPMKKHERNALNGDLFSGKKVAVSEDAPNERGRVIDLFIPIIFLIIFCIFALLYVGGIFDGASIIDAFANTDATSALPWGGLLALIASILFLALRKTVSLSESMDSIPKGFIAMVPAILILTFATALKNMTGVLGGANYVGDLMYSVPTTLAKFLPAIIFIVACILAFATGTSWGTFGILVPIVYAMYPQGMENALFIVNISACLAGAVCGDHCSPISDTTIMSSAGAECEHLNHVSTQLPYALFVAFISLACFAGIGYVSDMSFITSLPLKLWHIALIASVLIMIIAVLIVKLISVIVNNRNAKKLALATTSNTTITDVKPIKKVEVIKEEKVAPKKEAKADNKKEVEKKPTTKKVEKSIEKNVAPKKEVKPIEKKATATAQKKSVEKKATPKVAKPTEKKATTVKKTTKK